MEVGCTVAIVGPTDWDSEWPSDVQLCFLQLADVRPEIASDNRSVC